MTTEKKTITVLIGSQTKTLEKLRSEGWEVTGFGFASEGASHSDIYLERNATKKSKPKAKKK